MLVHCYIELGIAINHNKASRSQESCLEGGRCDICRLPDRRRLTPRKIPICYAVHREI